MRTIIDRLILDDKGQGIVEYGLLISLIVLVAIGAVYSFGNNLSDYYNDRIVKELP